MSTITKTQSKLSLHNFNSQAAQFIQEIKGLVLVINKAIVNKCKLFLLNHEIFVFYLFNFINIQQKTALYFNDALSLANYRQGNQRYSVKLLQSKLKPLKASRQTYYQDKLFKCLLLLIQQNMEVIALRQALFPVIFPHQQQETPEEQTQLILQIYIDSNSIKDAADWLKSQYKALKTSFSSELSLNPQDQAS